MRTFHGRYMTQNTAHFVQHIASELINEQGGQSIFLFRVNTKDSTHDSPYSIYNESTNKKFLAPVEIPCLVGINTRVTTSFENVDLEEQTELQAYILRETLKQQDIFPNIGDVIVYQRLFFEVYDIDDVPTLQGSPEYKYAINLMAHSIRRNKYDIPLPTDVPDL